MSGLQAPAPAVYRRHRPETTALYEVVRDNLETLYGANERAAREGALGAKTGAVTPVQRASSDLRLNLRPEP